MKKPRIASSEGALPNKASIYCTLSLVGTGIVVRLFGTKSFHENICYELRVSFTWICQKCLLWFKCPVRRYLDPRVFRTVDVCVPSPRRWVQLLVRQLSAARTVPQHGGWQVSGTTDWAVATQQQRRRISCLRTQNPRETRGVSGTQLLEELIRL